MLTRIEVTESDFEISLDGNDFLPILDIGEDSQYYVSWGHVESSEMIGYCNKHLEHLGEDLDDYKLSEEDITWEWAIALESRDAEHDFTLRWSNVGPETVGAFPITIVSIW